MSYIVIVNPSILATTGTGMPFAGVLSATVFIAFSMTLMMGLYARLPFAVAPGMGLNAFFAYTIILQGKVPWQTALGIVFWAGVLFLLISATPLRERIATAIPSNLRLATAAGIGLLLTFIGLRNAGLIEADPATMVRLGTLDYRSALLLFGLVVAVVLMRRNSPLAFLSSIFGVTLLAWMFGYAKPPEQIVSLPDFSSVALNTPANGMPVPVVARVEGLTITMYDIVRNVVTPPMTSDLIFRVSFLRYDYCLLASNSQVDSGGRAARLQTS